MPMLVALRGRAESKDPKKCELSDRQAVIHEVPIAMQPCSSVIFRVVAVEPWALDDTHAA